MSVRASIKQMIDNGISPFSIVSSLGGMVSPDEAKLLIEYEKKFSSNQFKPTTNDKEKREK